MRIGDTVVIDGELSLVIPCDGEFGEVIKVVERDQAHHVIHFDFDDGTDLDIDAYYDNAFISDAIKSTTPVTFASKTVDSASIDGVEWYHKPVGTWETVWDGNVNFYENDGHPPYCWIPDLGDIEIQQGSTWRVTFDGTETELSVSAYVGDEQEHGIIGNPFYAADGADDGSGITYGFYQTPWGAWSGGADVTPNTSHVVKIERHVIT